MKRILALLLVMLLLCGCTGEPEGPYVPTGGGLSWDADETIPDETVGAEEAVKMAYYPDRTLNPLHTADFTNRALFSLLYQGLFTVDSRYTARPILCKEYTMSADNRVYTFYLADATFSDGTPVTPEDVYETYDAAMDSSVYGGRFTHVYELELEEDGGITFRMDTPYENLPLLLDVPILKAGEVDADFPLGTGPYVYQQMANGARLLRRTDWWCRAALPITVSTINLMEATDAKNIRDSFELFGVSLVCADPNTDAYAEFRCDYELWNCENGNLLFLGCNPESPYFSDADVRSALTYAIDRQAIADKYYAGFAMPATLMASPMSPFYNKNLAAKYKFDPDILGQAVADAKFPPNTPLVLVVNRGDSLRLRVSREIKIMLESCGLAVTIVDCDPELFVETLQNGEYDLYLGQTRLSPNMDLSEFFAPEGSLNFGGLTNAAMYALCMDALANRGNYYNLHANIATDGMFCPILFQNYAVYATRGLLPELAPSRDHLYYYDLGRTASQIMTVQ